MLSWCVAFGLVPVTTALVALRRRVRWRTWALGLTACAVLYVGLWQTFQYPTTDTLGCGAPSLNHLVGTPPMMPVDTRTDEPTGTMEAIGECQSKARLIVVGWGGAGFASLAVWAVLLVRDARGGAPAR